MTINCDLMKIYSSDSSGDVWQEYYEPFYKNIGWDFWNIFDYPKSESSEKKRVYAKCYKNSEKYSEIFLNCQLGGEMDFNFNSNRIPKMWRKGKYEYYENLIKKDSEMTQNDKNKAYKLLKECKKRQYRCCNLSVFIRTGGLNNIKGKISQDKRALDRFDVFVFVLNDYFDKRNKYEKNGYREDYMHIIFSEAWHGAKENRERLYEYLKLYRNIEDYFKKNYNINNKELIKDLIESGSKPIDSGNRVIEYLEFAKRYWNAKEDGIKEVLSKVNQN